MKVRFFVFFLGVLFFFKESALSEIIYSHKSQVGIASWYGSEGGMKGRETSSGVRYNPQTFVAAHPNLPFFSVIKVTNMRNGKWLHLLVVDRFLPHKSKKYKNKLRGRIIDISVAAAKALGFYERGLTQVKVETVEKSHYIPAHFLHPSATIPYKSNKLPAKRLPPAQLSY